MKMQQLIRVHQKKQISASDNSISPHATYDTFNEMLEVRNAPLKYAHVHARAHSNIQDALDCMSTYPTGTQVPNQMQARACSLKNTTGTGKKNTLQKRLTPPEPLQN
jgi:hypothetical protein